MIIKEIQGFRVISLLLVLFYHLKVPGFEFGYLGVDIFFVISGFIFSKIILVNLESNNFNLFQYLKKRIIRLLPALLSTFFITTIFFWFILTPNELEYFGQSLFSSSLFLSNIYYYIVNFDYFSPGNYPLTHLWSLSLEVQFYLLLPIFYVFVYYLNFKKNITYIVLVVFTLSFLVNIIFANNKTLIFYLLPFRIWEFFLGYFIYDLIKKDNNKSLYKRFELFCIGGLFLFYITFGTETSIKYQIITLSFFFIMFFYSYNKKNILNQFLVNKYNQIISERSYSIFLIHYPVIFFVDYIFISEPYLKLVVIKLLLIIFLTEIIFKIESYYFIVGKKTKYKLNYGIVSFLSFLFIILGLTFHVTKGVQFRYIFNKDLIQNYYSFIYHPKSKNPVGIYPCHTLCKKIESYEKTSLLIGDSHAKDFEDALNFLSHKKKMNLYTLYELNNYHSFTDLYDNSQLKKLSKVLSNNSIDIVYLVHHLRKIKPSLYYKKLNQIIKNNTGTNFVYLKPRLEFNISPVKYMTQKFLKLNLNIQHLVYAEDEFLINFFKHLDKENELSKENKNLIFINQDDLLIQLSSPRCKTIKCFDGHDANFIPLYRDNHHITNYSAELILNMIEYDYFDNNSSVK